MATRFSKFRRLLAVSVSVAVSGLAFGASPPNILANINWSGPYTGGVKRNRSLGWLPTPWVTLFCQARRPGTA